MQNDNEKRYLVQKPYKEWTRSDIYYGIIHYRQDKGLPKLKRAYIIPTFASPLMRREFLKMTGAEGGRDIYGFNYPAIDALTDESLEILFDKYQGKKKKRPPRYRMEYIATWEDRYEIVEEEVDIEYRGGIAYFKSSYDGIFHRVKERGAKIIEVIYNE